ncbi:MAG: hypothetical protein AAB368_01625, partial [bacterium]
MVDFAADLLGFTPKQPAPAPNAQPHLAAVAKVEFILARHNAWRAAYPLAAAELDGIAKDLEPALAAAKKLLGAFPGQTFGPFNVNEQPVKKG